MFVLSKKNLDNLHDNTSFFIVTQKILIEVETFPHYVGTLLFTIHNEVIKIFRFIFSNLYHEPIHTVV